MRIFKLNTVNTKMTLQKLTNRSVDKFLQDKISIQRNIRN